MTQSSSWQPHEKLMKAFEALVVGETIHVFNAIEIGLKSGVSERNLGHVWEKIRKQKHE